MNKNSTSDSGSKGDLRQSMQQTSQLAKSTMGEAEFQRFSELIHTEFGIKMPPSKKVLLQSRFQKRLRALGLGSYKEYCDYVFSPEGREKERSHLIDVVTTNTTHFFREPKHWDIMNNITLPELWNRGVGRGGGLRLWSAGCSSGEEPYTLSMILHEWADSHQGFDFSILATDISTKILSEAKRAVYSMDKVAEVPMAYKKKYMLKSKDKKLVKMDRILTSKVSFQRLNFMENFKLPQQQDIIFCRNVVIYFDRPTQEVLFTKFCNNLKTGGYLFIGHSESLSGMTLPIKPVAPTVFQRV